MKYRFKTHYTRDEARALLPHVRLWLTRVLQLREALLKGEVRLGKIMTPGRDVGGPEVNAWLRAVADMQDVLREFQRREIQLKDPDRGLVDFPAIVDGKESDKVGPNPTHRPPQRRGDRTRSWTCRRRRSTRARSRS